jgi:hypothetical protein
MLAQTYPCRFCGELRSYRPHVCERPTTWEDRVPWGTHGRGTPARSIVLTELGWAHVSPDVRQRLGV